MSDTVTICFRIPVKADAVLRKLAAANRRSINAEAVMAIERHVGERRDHDIVIHHDRKNSFYADCSTCSWMSPYCKTENEIRAFALKHKAAGLLAKEKS